MRTFTQYTKDSLGFGKPRDELIIWYFDGIEDYIKEKHIEGFKITYLKEKYGGLRVEWQGGDDMLFEMCTNIENDSESTCVICGRRGKIRTYMFWWTCLCWRHNLIRRLQWLYRKIRP